MSGNYVAIEKLDAQVGIEQYSPRFQYGFDNMLAINAGRIILNPVNESRAIQGESE